MPAGRPTVYTDKLGAEIARLVREGKTTHQIAEILEVGERTIFTWQRENKELRQAIKEARSDLDDRVEVSLFRRAMGYTHPEEKVFCHQGNIITHKTIKHHPPDPTAMIFWLKNRRPEQWRDKQEVAHSLEPYIIERFDGTTIEIGQREKTDDDDPTKV